MKRKQAGDDGSSSSTLEAGETEMFHLILLRLEPIQSLTPFVTLMREWMAQDNTRGRLVSRAPNLNFLVIEGSSDKCQGFLDRYKESAVIENSQGVNVHDRFFQVLGTTKDGNSRALLQPGFNAATFLSEDMLVRVLTEEWKIPNDWISSCLTSEHTPKFTQWKAEAKAKRKEKRKKDAQARAAAKKINQKV